MVKKGKESEFYKNEKDKYETKTRFYVEYIDYNQDRKIKDLIIRDDKNNIRFSQLTKETEKKLNLQKEKLKKYIELAETKDNKFDREKFYVFFGVESDYQLTNKQVLEATRLLEKKYKLVEAKNE